MTSPIGNAGPLRNSRCDPELCQRELRCSRCLSTAGMRRRMMRSPFQDKQEQQSARTGMRRTDIGMSAERNTSVRSTSSSRVQNRPPHASVRDHLRRIADKRIGRVQRQVRRCLIALGSARIRDLLKWCYPSVLEFQPWHRTNIHRAANKVAEVKRGCRGRPNLWAPKSDIGTKQDKS